MAAPKPMIAALQPRVATYQNPQQQQQTGHTPNFCQEMSRVSEDEAWALFQLLSANLKSRGVAQSEACAALLQAEACRSWTSRRSEVSQLLARHGCRAGTASSSTSGLIPQRELVPGLILRPRPDATPTPTPAPTPKPPGSCGCASPKDPMNSMTPQQDWSSGCGAFRKPDPAATGVAFADQCAEAACRGGSRIGLEQIPWERELAPGATEIITLGYTRNARLVGLTFGRRRTPGRSYNIDNWSLRKWRTDKANQPYDFTRRGTTFNGVDPNEIWVPASQYYEDGDASVSPILHGMNPIPSMIPPNNIGNNDGLVEFELELAAAAPANETAFGFLLVLFLQGN